MERLQTYNVSIVNGYIKYLIGKSIFAVNLLLKLFPATVVNADIESPKSLHTFLYKIFVPHASEIGTKSYGPNNTKFWVFCQKPGFFKTIFDKALTAFWKTIL